MRTHHSKSGPARSPLIAVAAAIAAATLLVACSSRTPPRTAAGPKPSILKASMLRRAHAPTSGPAPTARTLRAGITPGTLAGGDARLPDGSRFDLWTYTAAAPERLVVTLSSSAFDAYLAIVRLTSDSLVTLKEDDDGAGGTNARVEIDLLEPGSYAIVANAVAASGRGAYALHIVAEPLPPPSTEPDLLDDGSVDWAGRYPGGGDPGERYALLVGIGDYPADDADLHGPMQDARILRSVLLTKHRFLERNIVVLADTLATRAGIVNAFRRHLGQAGPAGVAVFYYSGRGTHVPDSLGGAPSASSFVEGGEAFQVWGPPARGKATLLLSSEIEILANELTAGRQLLVTDACFPREVVSAGPGGVAKGLPWERLAPTTQLPARLLRPALSDSSPEGVTPGSHERILISAAGEGECAWTAAGWPTWGGLASVFTYYLANDLDAADRSTTFAEIVAQARQQTSGFTSQRYGAPQSPRAEGDAVDRPVWDFLRKR
jgi:hypothetical protein